MKKIIALVLFVTMLFAIVPVAGATGTGYTTNEFYVEVLEDGIWYAAQKPNDGSVDDISKGIGVDKDIKVTVSGNNAKMDENQAVGTTPKVITVNLKGSYSKAEAHWYSSNTNNPYTNVWGKVVKIPYQVKSVDDNITDVAFVDGYKNYNYINYDGKLFYYIDFALTEADSEQSYYISYANNGGRVIINVKWDNTDNNVTSSKGPHPSLKVVGYDSAAAQYGNFTVDFKDMSKGEKGRMTFNIAAYTFADRNKIWNASRTDGSKTVDVEDFTKTLEDLLNDEGFANITGITLDEYFMENGKPVYRSSFQTAAAWYRALAASAGSDPVEVIRVSGTTYTWKSADNRMDVRLKAFDSAGVAYPAGTVISIAQVQRNRAADPTWLEYAYVDEDDNDNTVWGWDRFLGKSSKYVNVGGEPTYVIDQQNCFVFSIGGIRQFAMAAGFYKDSGNWVAGAYTDEDIVLLYQNQYKLFQLVFTNGKVMEAVEFDIFFKNINRTKSGITVIGDREITVDLGSKISLPYVLDDAYAMSKDLTEAWVTSDSKIVKVTNKDNGSIEAVGVGKAYVYAKDAAGTFQIFIVNVVNPATVVPEAPTTDYKTYVVTASNLYVRTGPGTNYKSLGKLPRGTEVAGIEVDGSVWVQVNYKGTTAYMSGKYLAEK